MVFLTGVNPVLDGDNKEVLISEPVLRYTFEAFLEEDFETVREMTELSYVLSRRLKIFIRERIKVI